MLIFSVEPEGQAKLRLSLIHICFQIFGKDEVLHYNQCGVSEEENEAYAFEIMPGFYTPDWAKGAVMYQIFTDRFYNGDPENDVVDREYIYIGEPLSLIHI